MTDADRAWLLSRLEGAPPKLREAVLRACENAAGATVAERCADAAFRVLEGAENLATRRADALDLLAADALLTLACEHVAATDPERLAEFARSIGPRGALARDERPARPSARRPS